MAVLLLLCLAATALCACKIGSGGTETEEKTTASDRSETETTMTEPDTSFRIFGNQKLTPIVLSDIPDRNADDIKKELNIGLRRAFGVFPIYETAAQTAVNADRTEILVGTTNRPESTGAVPEAGQNDAWYYVGVRGNKLVINASNGYYLDRAIEYFVSCLPTEQTDRFSLPADFGKQEIFRDYFASRWKLTDLPAYTGARITLSPDTYTTGALMTELANKQKADARVQLVLATNKTEYLRYVDRLVQYGFLKESSSEAENNLYTTLTRGKERVYIYFTAAMSRVTVVHEKNGASVSEVSYTTANAGQSAELYQYGLNMRPYSDPTSGAEGYEINCGMLYIIRTADNRLIVIDGGDRVQMMTEAADGTFPHAALNRFLHRITGTKETEKITVSCWFLTHGHSDHLGFAYFLQQYADQYDLKSVCANLATGLMTSDFAETKILSDFGTWLKRTYPACREVRLHTGQKLRFADVEMQVLYTHEDALSPAGATQIKDFNDSTTVVKITLGGTDLLVLGDVYHIGEDYLTAAYTEATLHCDMMQVSHHGFNDLQRLSPLVRAKVALIPQAYGWFVYASGSSDGTDYWTYWSARIKKVIDDLKAYSDPNMIFFSGNESMTVGLSCRQGEVTVILEPARRYRLSDLG